MMADPYEQTGRRTRTDPEQRINPPEQDPAEVRRNNILGYLEEALNFIYGLEEALNNLYSEDRMMYLKMIGNPNLQELEEGLEEWQNEEEPD
jgi:hypothetical protein